MAITCPIAHLTHQRHGVQTPEVPGAGLGSAAVTIVRADSASKCRHHITGVTGGQGGVKGVTCNNIAVVINKYKGTSRSPDTKKCQ